MSENPPKRPLVIHSNAGRDKTRPPIKRLVGRKQYLLTQGAKGFTYSLGAICGSAGLLLVLLSLGIFVLSPVLWIMWEGEGVLPVLLVGTVVGGVGFGALKFAGLILSTVDEIDQVELITPQNTHLLPMRTTLVRASDHPITISQNELLRAAGHGQKTPDEELLRATEGSTKPD